MPTAKMSNAIYDTQAAFDPTICFTVYGSWIEAIEEVETASDICIDTPIYIREENMYMLRH